MLCISVKPPWSEFIIAGIKTVENRTWTSSYRGPLIIHASSNFDSLWDINQSLNLLIPANHHLKKMHYARGGSPAPMHLGHLVGAVRMTNATPLTINSPFSEPGLIHHLYTNALRFPNPFPYKGKTKLFDVPLTSLPDSLQTLITNHFNPDPHP